jgi:hypothetical protein
MSFLALPPACERKACKAVQGRRHRAKKQYPHYPHKPHQVCEAKQLEGGGGGTTHTYNTCMYVYCRPYLPQTVAEGTEVRGEGSAVVGKGTHDWSHVTTLLINTHRIHGMQTLPGGLGPSSHTLHRAMHACQSVDRVGDKRAGTQAATKEVLLEGGEKDSQATSPQLIKPRTHASCDPHWPKGDQSRGGTTEARGACRCMKHHEQD